MGKRSRKKKSDPYKYAFTSDRANAKDVAVEKGDMLKSAMYNTPSGGYNYDRLGSGRQAANAYNQQVNQYAKDKSQQVTKQNQYDKLRTPNKDFGKLGNKARRLKVMQQNQQGMLRPEAGRSRSPAGQSQEQAPAAGTVAQGQIKS